MPKLTHSLRFRLLLLILLAALPIIILILYNSYDQRQSARQAVQLETLREVRLVTNWQDLQIDSTRQLLMGISHSTQLQPKGSSGCPGFLSDFVAPPSIYYAVVVAGLDGRVFCASDPASINLDLSTADYFQSALQTDDLAGGGYNADLFPGQLVLPAAYPLHSISNQPTGVIVAYLDVAWLETTAAAIKLPVESALLIITTDGLIIDRFPEPEAYRGQFLPDTPLVQVIASTRGEGSLEVLGVDGIRRIYSYTPLAYPFTDAPIYIAIGIPSDIAYREVNQATLLNLLFIGVTLLIASLVIWYGSEIVLLRQIRELLTVTYRLGAGDLSARSGIPAGTGEISQLAAAFNQMAGRLQQRETDLQVYTTRLQRSNQDLQDFAYIASHDLQEPLRKIQAFGQLLKDGLAGSLEPDHLSYLERMQSGAARMQSMINDLLAYSRLITKAQPHSRVDLNQVAADVVADLEHLLVKTGGTVQVGTLPVIDAESTQMYQLIQNLVSNSLKFARPGVPPVVEVSCLAGDEHGNPAYTRLVVRDNGIGFEQKYAEKIFAPFQRLHGRGEYEGSGIGLAIVSKIALRHGGKVQAAGLPGQGATFTVTLPLRQS